MVEQVRGPTPRITCVLCFVPNPTNVLRVSVGPKMDVCCQLQEYQEIVRILQAVVDRKASSQVGNTSWHIPASHRSTALSQSQLKSQVLPGAPPNSQFHVSGRHRDVPDRGILLDASSAPSTIAFQSDEGSTMWDQRQVLHKPRRQSGARQRPSSSKHEQHNSRRKNGTARPSHSRVPAVGRDDSSEYTDTDASYDVDLDDGDHDVSPGPMDPDDVLGFGVRAKDEENKVSTSRVDTVHDGWEQARTDLDRARALVAIHELKVQEADERMAETVRQAVVMRAKEETRVRVSREHGRSEGRSGRRLKHPRRRKHAHKQHRHRSSRRHERQEDDESEL